MLIEKIQRGIARFGYSIALVSATVMSLGLLGAMLFVAAHFARKYW